MLNRLVDENSIKWITMQSRQFGQLLNRASIDWENENFVSIALLGEIDFGRFGKGKLA
jgi:hypothetical protein